MGWVTADDCQSAKVDPLADAAPRILGHMNSNHVPAMILPAKVHADNVSCATCVRESDVLLAIQSDDDTAEQNLPSALGRNALLRPRHSPALTLK